MPNQYHFGYQLYSPPVANGLQLNTNSNNNDNSNYVSHLASSPTFHSTYPDNASSTSSTSSSLGLLSLYLNGSSGASSYSYQNPRLRYYMSKSFDIEDDLEFCPDIPENFENSPPAKKFNPYTASVFLPQEVYGAAPGSPVTNRPQSPRLRTPRIKKPLEIINPQTKLRVASASINK